MTILPKTKSDYTFKSRHIQHCTPVAAESPEIKVLTLNIKIRADDRTPARCLNNESVPDRKYFYHNNSQQNITLLVTHKLETRFASKEKMKKVTLFIFQADW